MRFLRTFFSIKKYVTASDKDVSSVEFPYNKALEDLHAYDTGKLNKLNLSSGIKALQDYFEKTKKPDFSN